MVGYFLILAIRYLGIYGMLAKSHHHSLIVNMAGMHRHVSNGSR